MNKAKCLGCGDEFPSRSAVFRHLKDTSGQCLPKKDYEGYLQYLQKQDRHKVLLLYGYYGMEGNDAAQKLLQMVQGDDQKVNRSYGNIARRTTLVRQDEETGGAISEVLATRLPTILEPVDEWIQKLNTKLEPEGIYLIGRHDFKGKGGTFNAEIDISHRRVEYLLPLDFLYDSSNAHMNNMTRNEFFESLPDFSETSEFIPKEGREFPTLDTVMYLHKLKRIMQSLTTQIVTLDADEQEVVAKKIAEQREKQPKRQKGQQKKQNNKPKKSLLKRRRFHNFTPTCMAHEFVAYRRMDRMYHRATLRFEGERRPYLVLSLNGDLFLHGQVCRVIGVFLALARGLVDQDMVECLFDEKYGSLVPTPAAPSRGMLAGEASYVSWEGKVNAVLSPRIADRFSDGWNDARTLKRYDYWKDQVRERVARAWLQDGLDEDGRLVAEREWTETVLEPWSHSANQQLEEYRQWKKTTLIDALAAADVSDLIPSLDLVDSTVPAVFETVLRCLREADASGLWPSTTPKRQMVMISSLNDTAATKEDALPISLADAHDKAKNNKGQRSSAYIFAEGEGGASGSFSVGAMPGDRCIQPKGNSLFPELIKAAFQLEIALRPDREPSSTIAINRNAQFRPHTDSGAGAGQSTSLIVGLGTYAGGELVVEGEKKDIRYKAVEFNGWTQRHWTLPFKGERFSLVWFTPKGCEGVRGIDLCE